MTIAPRRRNVLLGVVGVLAACSVAGGFAIADLGSDDPRVSAVTENPRVPTPPEFSAIEEARLQASGGAIRAASVGGDVAYLSRRDDGAMCLDILSVDKSSSGVCGTVAPGVAPPYIAWVTEVGNLRLFAVVADRGAVIIDGQPAPVQNNVVAVDLPGSSKRIAFVDSVGVPTVVATASLK